MPKLNSPKKIIETIFTINHIVDFILFIIGLVCAYFCFKGKTPIKMNESQVLYLFSMQGQVVAGLFALTITGYIFYRYYLDNKLKEDDELELPINEHKKISDRRLKNIAFFSILAIVICILNISLISYLQDYKIIHSLVLTEGSVLSVWALISIITFSINTLNPNIKKITDKKLEQINAESENPEGRDAEAQQKSAQDFITYYEALVKIIITEARKVQQIRFKNFNGPINFSKAIRILVSNEVIEKNLQQEIEKIKEYKNLIDISDNKTINISKYYKLREVYNTLRVKINKYNGNNDK